MPWSRLSRFFGGWSSHLLIGNPYNGYINPYYWVEFPIPYYMEITGVDRPDRTYWEGRAPETETEDGENSFITCFLGGIFFLSS